ncbi:MAG: hypothetical protein E5Y60_06290 [Mesorhizobium sp.]|nr:MAG: hypothetical protein E5Y60_06290 [Mesorhizobium sp.]
MADAVQPKREKAAANRGFSMLDSPFGKLERVKRFERSTPTLETSISANAALSESSLPIRDDQG